MKRRTIIIATCAALALSMAGFVSAQGDKTETVMKNFEAAIPNIPGKSLLAVEVEYASGAIESKMNDGETRINNSPNVQNYLIRTYGIRSFTSRS